MAPNNSFKPNLLRYTNNMAGKACHVVASATQVGLTQALGRMREITAIGVMVLLGACGEPPSHPTDLSKTDIGTMAGCPALPGVDSVQITHEDGPDFRICKYTHKATGKVLFDVYVGEHPENPKGLKFGGTTRSNGRDLIWFNTPTGGWGKPRIWHTYLPTGSPRGTVMVVTLTTYAPGQLQEITPLVAHLRPSI